MGWRSWGRFRIRPTTLILSKGKSIYEVYKRKRTSGWIVYILKSPSLECGNVVKIILVILIAYCYMYFIFIDGYF